MLEFSVSLKETSRSQTPPPPPPPPSLPALTSSLGSHAQGKESHNSDGRTQGEGQDGEGSEGHKGEGEGQDGEGIEVQDGEGSAQGQGQDGEGSTLGQGPDSHQRDRLSKLHRPTWVKELFFSLQTAQKVSLNETCDWVMEHMPSVFCPNGKPLMPSTVCIWKSRWKERKWLLIYLTPCQRSVAQSHVVNVVLYRSERPTIPRFPLPFGRYDSSPVQCWVPTVKHITDANGARIF